MKKKYKKLYIFFTVFFIAKMMISIIFQYNEYVCIEISF